MCGSMLSGPKAPPPVQIPTAEPPPPVVDTGAAQAVNASRDARRRRLQADEATTLATGGQGLTDSPTTTTKQFFGQ